ncbi:MAG: RNA polymerase sigma factor [Candidatus Dojkabacteria bacterium]
MHKTDLTTEKVLLERAQQGAEGFTELYNYYVKDVYRFSYAMLLDQGEAEDVTSQVFLEFYRKIQEITWQGVSLKNWLFTTARFTIYRKWKKPATYEYNDDRHTENEAEISFTDEILTKDMLEIVKKEIEAMKPKEREVIILRLWEENSFTDIATILQSTESAVKKRFYRSIEKLRAQLKEKGHRNLCALPILFTSIREVPLQLAYHVPTSLTGTHNINKIVHNQTPKQPTMIKQFITTNALPVIIAGGVVITGVVGGVTLYQANKSDGDSSDTSADTTTMAPTPEQTQATSTPTQEPTSTVTESTINTTVSPSQVQNLTKTCNAPQIGVTFQIPENWICDNTDELLAENENVRILVSQGGRGAGCSDIPEAESNCEYVDFYKRDNLEINAIYQNDKLNEMIGVLDFDNSIIVSITTVESGKRDLTEEEKIVVKEILDTIKVS